MTRKASAVPASVLDQLREAIPSGSTVFTILRSVSRSGMTRHISPITFTADCEPRNFSFLIAQVTGYRLTRAGGDNALVLHGAGMDMGFELVYTLSRALYQDGYALNHRWL